MSLFTSIAPLLLVLAMLAGLLWWLRWTAGAQMRRGRASGRHIQVIETVELGPGRCLHLVELGGRGLLVASTSQRCDLLCELDSIPAEKPGKDPAWVDSLFSRLKRT